MLKKANRILIIMFCVIMTLNQVSFAAENHSSNCLAPQKTELIKEPSLIMGEYFSSLIISEKKQQDLNRMIKHSAQSNQTIEFKGQKERLIANIVSILNRVENEIQGSSEANNKILSEAFRIDKDDELADADLLFLVKKIKAELINGNITLRVIDISLSESDIMTVPAFYSKEGGISFINISKDMFLDLIHSGFKDKVSIIFSQMIVNNIIAKGNKDRLSDAVLVERYFMQNKKDEKVLSEYHNYLLEYYQKKFYENYQSGYGEILVELGNPQISTMKLSPALKQLTVEINQKAQELLILKPLLLFKVMARKFKEILGGISGIIASVFFSVSFLAAIIVNNNYKIGMEQLSELGISEVSWLFNAGSIVAGIFIVPFAKLVVPSYIKGKGKMILGALMLALSGLGLSLVGLFPKDIQPMHNISAAIFFLTGALGIGISTSSLAKKLKLKWPMIITAVAFVPSSIVFLLTRNALLETIAAITFTTWFFLASYSIIKAKKRSVKNESKKQREMIRYYKSIKNQTFVNKLKSSFLDFAA